MTQRFGYWIIGTALATVPVAGCAQWGRSTTSPSTVADAAPSWGRESQSRGASCIVPAPESYAATGDTEALTLRPEEGRGLLGQPPDAHKESVPEPVIVPAGPVVTPVPKIELALPTAGGPALPPPSESETFPIAPVTGHAEPARREPLVDALDCLFENRYNDALQYLQKYDRPTQEVALRLLPVLKLMTEKSIERFTPEEVAALDDQMQSLWESLRPRSQLTIDKACFCERIISYGLYDELPEGHAFQVSTPNRPGECVLLYVEVRNFASEAKNGSFVTRLVSKVEIRDQKGVRVWPVRFADEKPIRSQTLLHDYCNKYMFYLPPNLTPGTYTLEIQITDQTRPDQPRKATNALELHVTSTAARVP